MLCFHSSTYTLFISLVSAENFQHITQQSLCCMPHALPMSILAVVTLDDVKHIIFLLHRRDLEVPAVDTGAMMLKGVPICQRCMQLPGDGMCSSFLQPAPRMILTSCGRSEQHVSSGRKPYHLSKGQEPG